MPYRRHSSVKFSQSSRTSISGKGNVTKRPPIGGGGTGQDGEDGEDAENPIFTADATSVAPTADADVDLTGVYPNLNLAFKIPKGEAAAPPTAINFTISGESGDHSAAYISGSYPNWHISLVLQRGEKGDAGLPGPPGICNCTCECCNGGGEPPPTCPEGYYWDGTQCVPNP